MTNLTASSEKDVLVTPDTILGELQFQCDECGEWGSDVVSDRVGFEGLSIDERCAVRMSDPSYTSRDDETPGAVAEGRDR